MRAIKKHLGRGKANGVVQGLVLPGVKKRIKHTHLVQFYERDEYLIKTVKEFLASGDGAIVIGTAVHKAQLEKDLKLSGLNLDEATKSGRYLYLDARETLDRFMVDGTPDSNLFFEVIGGIITRVLRNCKKLKIFGEMVALLFEEGNHKAVLKLEQLWNELQKIHSFTLFCAYPMKSFGRTDVSKIFEEIEMKHSHVIPGESFANLSTLEEKYKEIALLQLKARALEQEIEEHKNTEIKLIKTVSSLRASEELTTKIIENTIDCIGILDHRGKILTMNQSGCREFEGENAKKFIGRPFAELWTSRYLDKVKAAIKLAKKGGVGRFQAATKTMDENERWWDVIVTPIYMENVAPQRLLSISRDITLLKELERRREDFLNITSHELKTPLTSTKAFVQLLQARLKNMDDEKSLRYINKIAEQINKLINLVTELLDVSKIKAGKLRLKKEKFDLVALCEETIAELRLIYPKYKFEFADGKQVFAFGDREKIAQVLVNLLSNAAKYSKPGSTVRVEMSGDAKNVQVAVVDQGIGIDQDLQERIFERFFRVQDHDERTYPGLGMGLYIAAEIIRRHKGKIWVESRKGKGSKFIFKLPKA